jgi:hypothetical protein
MQTAFLKAMYHPVKEINSRLSSQTSEKLSFKGVGQVNKGFGQDETWLLIGAFIMVISAYRLVRILLFKSLIGILVIV